MKKKKKNWRHKYTYITYNYKEVLPAFSKNQYFH